MPAKDATYYDKHLRHPRQMIDGYLVPYSSSLYYKLWEQVAFILASSKPQSVLEIGCGTGQLAHLLFDRGLVSDKTYCGTDFSSEAIKNAKSRVALPFFQEDAATAVRNYKFTHLLAVEVLEHLDDDLDILSAVPLRTVVVGSVPNFDDPAHVRFFASEKALYARYGGRLRLEAVSFVRRTSKRGWYVFKGVRR